MRETEVQIGNSGLMARIVEVKMEILPFYVTCIVLLLGYLWFLARIVARPKPLVKPVKDSKGWLIAQTVFSWLCSFLFGFLTFLILGVVLFPGSWGIAILVTSWAMVLGTLGAPLLFALSIRWTVIVGDKWKARG